MNKMLPITDNVYLCSYTYDSYLNCIMRSKYRIGEIVAVFKISSYDQYQWKVQNEDIDFIEKNGKLVVHSKNKYNLSMNGIVYRDVKEEDEIELNIIYSQYCHKSGYLGVFLYDEHKNIKYISLNSRNCGLYSYTEYGVKHDLDTQLIKQQDKIVLKKKGQNVQLIVRRQEKDMVLAKITLEKSNSSSLKIGVDIKLGDNCYYKWMFLNHIQWKYYKDPNSWIKLDFESTIRRDWVYYSINYFVLYETETISFIKDLQVDILDYIRQKINHSIYLELELDSYDIVDTVKYRKVHHEHQCLIYGYSDDKRVVYIICTNKGKPIKSIITYNEFLNQLENKQEDFEIHTLKYRPDLVNDYEFSPKLCIDSLKKFLNSESQLKTDIVIPTAEFYYGINVYDAILEQGDLHDLILDKRICNMICEHTKCMLDRIKYMIAIHLVSPSEVEELLNQAEANYNLSMDVQIYHLKYIYNRQEKLLMKIRKSLECLKDCDYKLHQNLLDHLMMKYEV